MLNKGLNPTSSLKLCHKEVIPHATPSHSRGFAFDWAGEDLSMCTSWLEEALNCNIKILYLLSIQSAMHLILLS